FRVRFTVTAVLVEEGLNVYAVDASPSFVEAFRHNLPGIPVACEGVEVSTFFKRKFDAVLAGGLMFLLPADERRRLIQRIAHILVPGGRLLFTADSRIISMKGCDDRIGVGMPWSRGISTQTQRRRFIGNS